ncbi:hypothetical protein CAOG_03873 [Capsaspora owczarzaki ATCC 30864]|uniref:hypothetical protein n=1 Tax=Capsaspora owczarzaki (strain ATCC 30864) TaxID=595528 RepID=UPI0001FE2680|nr:hypothetical protein CAOG_03873 [Capsaspora owczarzaki ATCC 30864]|eukprot:XP_004363601.1 hypothetical protein CAOG_03873 [Capsaspora owczarzaki ATCC 30864]
MTTNPVPPLDFQNTGPSSIDTLLNAVLVFEQPNATIHFKTSDTGDARISWGNNLNKELLRIRFAKDLNGLGIWTSGISFHTQADTSSSSTPINNMNINDDGEVLHRGFTFLGAYYAYQGLAQMEALHWGTLPQAGYVYEAELLNSPAFNANLCVRISGVFIRSNNTIVPLLSGNTEEYVIAYLRRPNHYSPYSLCLYVGPFASAAAGRDYRVVITYALQYPPAPPVVPPQASSTVRELPKGVLPSQRRDESVRHNPGAPSWKELRALRTNGDYHPSPDYRRKPTPAQ